MAHDPVFNEDKKKIKVVQPKAADPGFAFFLETEDGTPFDSRLKIMIEIIDITANPPVTYETEIQVKNHVYETKIPVLAPFGDKFWKDPAIDQLKLPFEITVEFLDAPADPPVSLEGEVEVKIGEFAITITPLTPPQTAFSYIIKGLRMLLGLDRA